MKLKTEGAMGGEVVLAVHQDVDGRAKACYYWEQVGGR